MFLTLIMSGPGQVLQRFTSAATASKIIDTVGVSDSYRAAVGNQTTAKDYGCSDSRKTIGG